MFRNKFKNLVDQHKHWY